MGMQDEMKKFDEQYAGQIIAKFKKEKDGMGVELEVSASIEMTENLIMSLITSTVDRVKKQCDDEDCKDPHDVISFVSHIVAKIKIQEMMKGMKDD